MKQFRWLRRTWRYSLPILVIVIAIILLRRPVPPPAVSPSPPALSSDGIPAPVISAASAVVQDVGSGIVFYAKNADIPRLPASTTKIMTALVALDAYPDLNLPLTVQVESQAIGSSMKLVKGERITVKNLLYGLMIPSGNDAALALADNFPGGYNAFVDAMNRKAADLHLTHTHYKNPSGVEQLGHETTARDLASLASVAMQNPVIAEIVKTPAITVTDVTGKIAHRLESTDKLLGTIPGLLGLKTGWTENAGECLVSYVDRDGRRIVSVVLDSSDRFADTRALIDWAYTHHTWF